MTAASNAPLTSVVVPAFNEGPMIAPLIVELKAAAPWRESLVDDNGSTDQTGEEAVGAGARVVRHSYNKGNGAAVKTGVREATGTFVLIVDADGQHRPADAMRLVARLDTDDLVVGARMPASQASRARRSCLMEFLHLLPNGFSTPTTTTLAVLKAGYSVRFEPIEAARRQGRAKIRLGPDGASFFLILLKVITIFSPLRIFVPVSLVAFAPGAAYALWTIAIQSHVTNSSVLLILLSLLIFLIGLVSEQIASLRFEGPRR